MGETPELFGLDCALNEFRPVKFDRYEFYWYLDAKSPAEFYSSFIFSFLLFSFAARTSLTLKALFLGFDFLLLVMFW